LFIGWENRKRNPRKGAVLRTAKNNIGKKGAKGEEVCGEGSIIATAGKIVKGLRSVDGRWDRGVRKIEVDVLFPR